MKTLVPFIKTDREIYGFPAIKSAYKSLVIIYSNANIDLLVNEEDIYNLPDYKNKNMTQDKTVNHACFYKEYTYLSTASGILCINLKKREISNYYPLNKNVLACNPKSAECKQRMYNSWMSLADNFLYRNGIQSSFSVH